MKGAILLLLATGCLRAQQGSLEGTAVHAVTREPLSRVHVRLIAAGFAGVTGAYGAMSDTAGHFSIATIRPGTYILMPERTGFLHVLAKGSTALPTLTIKAGEAVTGYQQEMAPAAVISGRVVNEAGDPVQGVGVQTVAVTPGSTPMMLMSVPNPGTDDRGEFRLVEPAGKYYVQANIYNSFGGQDRPEKRSDGTSEATYATTFYPSSLRKERGAVVEAVAGKEVTGIEIRLAQRQQQGLGISGVVIGSPAEGHGQAYVVMMMGESAQRITGSRSTTVGAEGRFRFEGLQPGFYRVWAMYNDGANTQLSSRVVEAQLENSEIVNVELALTAGVDLAGSVKMEGEAAGAAPKRKVKLEALGYMTSNLGTTGGEVDESGMFRIGNIAPVKYRVKVEPLAENAYIKTLEIDGAAVTKGVADLSKVARGASAKIVLASNAAQISGRILDAKGEPMPSNAVIIMLTARMDEEDLGQAGNGTAQATPDGKYSIKGVVPGKYRIFALDIFDASVRGGADDGVAMFKKLFERAEEIEFKEGDRIVKDLKVMPVEDANAKPKE